MEHPGSPDRIARIAALDDVELVRMLTVDADRYAADMLKVAEAEAQRRGLPIDERFLPESDAEPIAATGGAFAIGGATVRCAHCGGMSFDSRDVLMNTRGLTSMKLDWLNRSATALVCTHCSAIQLFAATPVAADER